MVFTILLKIDRVEAFFYFIFLFFIMTLGRIYGVAQKFNGLT